MTPAFGVYTTDAPEDLAGEGRSGSTSGRDSSSGRESNWGRASVDTPAAGAYSSLSEIIEAAWDSNPEDRPSFREIEPALRALLHAADPRSYSGLDTRSEKNAVTRVK
jgi:hypothetical protein